MTAQSTRQCPSWCVTDHPDRPEHCHGSREMKVGELVITLEQYPGDEPVLLELYADINSIGVTIPASEVEALVEALSQAKTQAESGRP